MSHGRLRRGAPSCVLRRVRAGSSAWAGAGAQRARRRRASCRRRRASPRRCSRSGSAIASSASRRSAGFPAAVASAAEGRHVSQAGCRDHRAAAAGSGVRARRSEPAASQLATLGDPDRDRRSRVAGERVLDDSPDRRRGRRAGPRRAPAWPASNGRLDRVKAAVAGRAAEEGADHRRPPHRDADRHRRRRTGFVPARHRGDRRRRERAGRGRRSSTRGSRWRRSSAWRPTSSSTSARWASRPRTRSAGAGSPRVSGSGRRWSRRSRDGRVHAVHDEAFVVPGPRIVDVAETMAAWFHGAGSPMSQPVLRVRNVGWQRGSARRSSSTCRFDVAAGRVRRDHGPQRRRQEHAARHHRRPAGADRRDRGARRIGRSRSGPPSNGRGCSRICRRASVPIWRCTRRRSC